ncbi:hypothetical protein ACSSS7_000678 [Eimeria intestinalis]
MWGLVGRSKSGGAPSYGPDDLVVPRDCVCPQVESDVALTAHRQPDVEFREAFPARSLIAEAPTSPEKGRHIREGTILAWMNRVWSDLRRRKRSASGLAAGGKSLLRG